MLGRALVPAFPPRRACDRRPEDADSVEVGPLLDKVSGPLASVTADGAYDPDGVYAEVAERHPDAAVMVPPPRRTATLSDKEATAPTQRNCHLQCIAETRRRAWQKASGYNKRAKSRRRSGDGNT